MDEVERRWTLDVGEHGWSNTGDAVLGTGCDIAAPRSAAGRTSLREDRARERCRAGTTDGTAVSSAVPSVVLHVSGTTWAAGARGATSTPARQSNA